jgi:hypothetical protein
MRGRRGSARQPDERADLERRLHESEQTVSELRAELKRLNLQALEVARLFEAEAAARAEAEAEVEMLRRKPTAGPDPTAPPAPGTEVPPE